MELFVSVTIPPLRMPPPSQISGSMVSPLIVLLFTVTDPEQATPPPVAGTPPSATVLPLIVLLITVIDPEQTRPPPPVETQPTLAETGQPKSEFPMMVLHITAAFAYSSNAKRAGAQGFGTVFLVTPQSGGGTNWSETILYSFAAR